MLNPHHLELFYFVARHGGISRAARHMPYGIQQPAISEQMRQLEETVGVKLFERAPFRLTAAGQELFGFVQPFFGGLAALESKLRESTRPQLRIAAAETILRDHLPAALRRVRADHPGLNLSLRSGYQPQFETWLREDEIDLAITPLERTPGRRLARLPLLRLPLVLLVPRRSPYRHAADFWSRPGTDLPLISTPETETLSRNFQAGLARRRRTWIPTITASSLDTVARYVADGLGCGVSCVEATRHRGVRELLLEDFPPLVIVALTRSRPNPIVTAALDATQHYAREMWPRHALA
jgi:DNA-binding transcriptional LysR family regulator